jgi:hypothetical protein
MPVVALLIISLGLCDPSPAAEFSCGAGDVACLIAAINTANANGEANTITLEAGTYTLTAVNNNTDGPNGLPVITSPFPLTLQGAGTEATIIDRIASAPPFRILFVEDTGTLTLNGLTIRGGAASGVGGAANGGCINNNGMLTITNSTITGNAAEFVGGGIVANGTVIITDSTITDNTADRGAGIYFGASVTLTITNSTIARNRATSLAGGGIMGGASVWRLPSPSPTARSRTTRRVCGAAPLTSRPARSPLPTARLPATRHPASVGPCLSRAVRSR